MAKALLLNMRDYTIVQEFETMELAQEAQDSGEEKFQGFPKHIVDREDWDLTAVDLVKFYNKLTGDDNVKRFETRAIGMKRLLSVLNGETLPITDEMKKKAEARTARTGEFHSDDSTTTTGDDDMATKKKGKAKKTKTTKTKTPRAPRVEKVDTTVLKATKAGTDRRWHEEANRFKLFAQIQKKDGITVAELIKFGASALKMDAGEVRAAIAKLVDAKAAGGASVRTVGGG